MSVEHTNCALQHCVHQLIEADVCQLALLGLLQKLQNVNNVRSREKSESYRDNADARIRIGREWNRGWNGGESEGNTKNRLQEIMLARRSGPRNGRRQHM